jgi:hypothetical protein
MTRSIHFAMIVCFLLLGATRSDAQTISHRPNPNVRNSGVRTHAHSAEAGHFSAQPIYPNRFSAMPIYPRTTFWSSAYPSLPVGPGYSLDDLANLGGPVYYPNTDIPFNRPDFDARIR